MRARAVATVTFVMAVGATGAARGQALRDASRWASSGGSE